MVVIGRFYYTRKVHDHKSRTAMCRYFLVVFFLISVATWALTMCKYWFRYLHFCFHFQVSNIGSHVIFQITLLAILIHSFRGREVKRGTVYPKKYAHGFVVLCFVVVMHSFIMNLHEVFIHIHQGCFAGTGAIVRLPQRQWSKPDGYGKISQSITTTKHSKAKTVCIFLGIYCKSWISHGMLL